MTAKPPPQSSNFSWLVGWRKCHQVSFIQCDTTPAACGEASKPLQTTTATTSPPSHDATSPDALNLFFARFDNHPRVGASTAPSREDPALILQHHRVSSTLRSNTKAAGPDRMPGRTLKACADQLTGVLTNIFNLSLYPYALNPLP